MDTSSYESDLMERWDRSLSLAKQPCLWESGSGQRLMLQQALQYVMDGTLSRALVLHIFQRRGEFGWQSR